MVEDLMQCQGWVFGNTVGINLHFFKFSIQIAYYMLRFGELKKLLFM